MSIKGKIKVISFYQIDEEKVFHKIWHPFIIKVLNKMRLEAYLHLTKAIYDKPIANIILNSEKY